MKRALFLLSVMGLTLGACVSVEHLGERTGKAYHRVFAKQVKQAEPRHKEMEAEMAALAAERMWKDSAKVLKPAPTLGGR